MSGWSGLCLDSKKEFLEVLFTRDGYDVILSIINNISLNLIKCPYVCIEMSRINCALLTIIHTANNHNIVL